MGQYKYKKLDQNGDEIRLLRIKPLPSQSSTDDSLIICSLEHASLKDKVTDHIALSYVWGEKPTVRNPKHAISLEGNDFPVTENLYTALQHLRRQNPGRIWIDAVCINQSDDDEKSDQIPKMRPIYERASEVIVWLGPSGDGSDALLDLVVRIGNAVTEHELAGLTLRAIRELSREELALKSRKLNLLFKDVEDVLPYKFPQAAWESFSRRPWWRRVWVVQELALNANPIFMVGNRKIHYQLLRNFTSILILIVNSTPRHSTDSEERRERLDAILNMYSATAVDAMLSFRAQFQNEAQTTLYGVLKSTIIRPSAEGAEDGQHALAATVERDRVFPVRYDTKQAASNAIPWSNEDVYCTTTGILLKHGYLEVLALTRDPLAQKAAGLPSWVCTWKQSACEPPYGDGNLIDRPFQAGGRFETGDVLFPANQPKVVSIRGVRVGKVVEMTTHVPPDVVKRLSRLTEPGTATATARPELVADWTLQYKFLEETRLLVSRANWSSPPEASHLDMARLLVGDYERDVPNIDLANAVPADEDLPLLSIRPQPHKCRCSQGGWKTATRVGSILNLLKIGNLVREVKSAAAENVATPEVQEKQEKLKKLLPGLQIFNKQRAEVWPFLKLTMERRVWRTETGYAGLGPAQMEKDDVVVVFKGSPLPSVLRKVRHTDRWQLVGEAYVHGSMDGELMSRPDMATERFELE